MHLLAKEDLPSDRKARGAFFTPPALAEFIVDWALRESTDRVFEPSCGEAAFLLPAGDRLRQLGAQAQCLGQQLFGNDIHSDSVSSAQRLMQQRGLQASLQCGDFFQESPKPFYEAVVGNPPYIRYQNFGGATRAAALEAALRQGVRLNGLSSSWAAFTVHAASFLKPGGRLGLVLPAELLAVKYASQIREFLLRRFSSVRLVLFDNLVFPGVLEDVVLLLAEGTGGAAHFEVYQARDAEDLRTRAPETWTGFKPTGAHKWTGALLSSDATALYEEINAGRGFEVMADWGDTYLGSVTGNNNYFTLTKTEVAEWGFEPHELLRISPPGAKHLKGVTFSEHAWVVLAEEGARCYLFAPKQATLSPAAKRYIKEGEKKGIHKAYKCSVRTPWWSVPLVERPDLLFAYMNHERPRLVRNGAGVQLLNSLYGVRLHALRKVLGEEALSIASLNSVTLLGAEMVGRAYGGGMLKHEPTEVAALPVPSEQVLQACGSKLALLSSQVGALLRRNDITPAVDMVDRIVLQETLGISGQQISTLRQGRSSLLQRRMTRAKGSNGSDR